MELLLLFFYFLAFALTLNSFPLAFLQEVVFRVDLSHVEPMKRILKAVDLLSRIGICFAADVRDAQRKNLVLKAVASFPGIGFHFQYSC